MLYKKTALTMVFLSAINVVPAWALGEAAAEVTTIIESERSEPVKDDSAERAARIEAARQAVARKQADEKAVAEKKEKERLAAAETERLAAKDEQKHSAAGQAPVTADPLTVVAGKPLMANTEAVSPPAGSENRSVTEPARARLQNEPMKGAEGLPDKSWWSTFTDNLGLTDSDPGVTVQPLSSKTTQAADYLIGPGDVIVISVWRDENLTRTVTVLPDGKISLPLVGELVAEGKTVAMLKQEAEKALSRYTADSTVSVEVKQSNSMFVFVTGRVNTPGRQILVANTNVLQALSMAGGPNPFAQKSKIRIFRQHEGKTAMFSFNYNEVMEGRHLEMNIDLMRGDVIIVP